MKRVKISVIHGDAFQIKADTLILKYAQAPYGLDKDIIREFDTIGSDIENKLPKVWGYFFTESKKITNTKNILFIGVTTLRDFGYEEIRKFGKKSLISLASSAPDTKSVLFTIHGPGYGLDEIESFESQIAGILDAINSEDYPDSLDEITFVERSKGRADRLQNVINILFPDDYIPNRKTKEGSIVVGSSADALRTVGYDSEDKKRIFVAMPFAKDFDDHFHYGIQGAVKSLGFLCERADLQSFTGDVMNWVKKRIATADFVIADLTTANPNVYLEVGYAWGLNKETILLVKNTDELKFDTKSQRCLQYGSIKELETKLKSELENLIN